MYCFSLLSLVFLDSNSSVPRMHFALTTPQASAVTAGLASMEMDASVYQTVRALTLIHSDTFIIFLFLSLVVNIYMKLVIMFLKSFVVCFWVTPVLLLQVLHSVLVVR